MTEPWREFTRAELFSTLGVHAYHVDRGELFDYDGEIWEVVEGHADRLCARVALAEPTFSEYQARAAKTAIYPGRGSSAGLAYAALGLGESGEVQNKVKKVLRDSGGAVSPERREAIAQELGDLLWYIGAMCDELGLRMGRVATDNLAKLADRERRGVVGGDGDRR